MNIRKNQIVVLVFKRLAIRLSAKIKNFPLLYQKYPRFFKKTVSCLKQFFSLSPRFAFHISLIAVVVFVSFSHTFASKRQTASVLSAKVLPVQQKSNVRVLATLASAVNSFSGVTNNPNTRIVPEPSLAVTSENCLAKPTYTNTVISDKTREGIITYKVVSGDTLSSIAAKFNITTDTIRWANNIEDADFIKEGQELIILPVSGVLHTVAAGDTLESIATMYQASVEMIIKQNKLEDKNLKEGQQLIVPDGKKPEPPKPPKPEPEPAPATTSVASSYPSPSQRAYYGGGGGNFPYGYCTWYAASRHPVPPGAGNAWTWFGAAQAAGWPTGYRPAPGAIMVTWESAWGHVAIVESVYGNTFTVSEMNYVGWGVISSRTITTSSVPLIGFIY